ncbi:hypothetical protein LTR28_000149, partial [Elasticomyces elasticus]
VFGPDSPIDEKKGNHVLRVLQYRRVSGSLIDVGISFPPDEGVPEEAAWAALNWLRATFSVDEQAAGQRWADEETAKLEQTLIKRAEGLGLYKKDPKDDGLKDDGPQRTRRRTSGSASLYGESALDAIRKENEEAYERDLAAQREADAKAAESGQQPPSRSVSLTHANIRAELEKPREKSAWLKYYEDQAQILKTDAIPQLSNFQRLAPTLLFMAFLLGGCILLSQQYVPPPKSARMFPDTPPSVATLGTLIAANVLVYFLWRFPPLYRTMNKYFLQVPAYPYALGSLGHMFSHQQFWHLAASMLTLWFFGLKLHEDVGRGNFLAVYFGTGAIVSSLSLVAGVLGKRWGVYSFGASACTSGMVAASCLINPFQHCKIPVLEWRIPLDSRAVLGFLVAVDVLWILRGGVRTTKGVVGHLEHLVGFAAGTGASVYYNRRMARMAGDGEMRAVRVGGVEAVED